MIPVRSDLQALKGYHSAQVDVDIRLNTNESPFGPPDAFRAAYAAEVAEVAWHRYPDRAAIALRAAIAQFHHVEPEMVFAANGSNEVLQCILLAYGGHGRNVATFEPTYQMHAQIARVAGATVVSGTRNEDFTLDPAEVERVVTEHQPSVTFLTSPNNPTGLVEPAERIEQLLAMRSGLVVADEAYAQFADWSALSLVAEDAPLVVTRTFSKTWSMAGLRLGYAIGPTWFVEEMEKVVLPYHLDASKQIAGRLCLEHVDEMEQTVRTLTAERERVSAHLDALGLAVVPSGANFVLFRPQTISGHELWQALVERSILVRDCSGWPRLADCLRVTIGTESENTAFLSAVADIIGTPNPGVIT